MTERERIIEVLRERTSEMTQLAGMGPHGLPALQRAAECQRIIAVLSDPQVVDRIVRKIAA